MSIGNLRLEDIVKKLQLSYSEMANWKAGLQFQFIKQLKKGIPNLRTCRFEASEDIITKFISQALHVIRIKY